MMLATNIKTHIRWMIRQDAQDVMRIERNSFTDPWTDGDFRRCLRQRECIGMVCESGNDLVGFMIYELHKSRLHLLNLAVDPRFRRMGIGSAMVDKLKSKLCPQARNRIMLEVRESNVGAQLFFRDRGFRCVDILREFYERTKESAYLMQHRITENV